MSHPRPTDGAAAPGAFFGPIGLGQAVGQAALEAADAGSPPPLDQFLHQACETLDDITPTPIKLFSQWMGTLPDLAASSFADFTLPELAGITVRDYRFLDRLPESKRQEVWTAALDQLTSEGVAFPRERIDTYEHFISYLHDHGIDSPQRILSLRTALILMNNRERLTNPGASDIGRDRPIAVIIGAKSDPNGALDASEYPTLDTFVQCGQFDVIYFESGSEAEADRLLNQVHDQTGHRIHTILFDGHGERQSLHLSCSGTDPDDAAIDVHDLERDGAFANLNDILDPNGQIILGACLNGAPLHARPAFISNTCDDVLRLLSISVDPIPSDEDAPLSERYNLAQAFSHLAPGRPVYSSEVETNFRSVRFDPETLRPHISWVGNSEYVAQAGLAEYYAVRDRTAERSAESVGHRMALSAAIASLSHPSHGPSTQRL